jgi:hypothetical protein
VVAKRSAPLRLRSFGAHRRGGSFLSPNTVGKPFGWMAEKDWQETVEVLKQYGGVTTPLEAQQLYTNEFVPTGAEFIPPPPEAHKT